MRALPMAVALLACSPALADEVAGNRYGAAMVEWMVANCSHEGIPAMQVAMSAMVINGSSAEDLAVARGRVRADIESRYPEPPSACDDLKASMAPTP